jgi:uncharacterized protein with HEPN domain
VPPSLADRIRHIIRAIDDIQGLLADASRQEFADDRFRRLAVERLFEIISEASRYIPDEAKNRQRDIQWRRMADLGNRLRHAYHLVDADTLWDIAKHDLPPLKVFVEKLIEEDRA